MSWRLLKCPACGGNMDVTTDREIIFCQFCGAKLVKDEDRVVIEHVERKIDEARIRAIEFEKEKYHSEKKSSKWFFIAPNIAAGVFLFLGALSYFVNPKDWFYSLFIIIGMMILVVGNMAGFTMWIDRKEDKK